MRLEVKDSELQELQKIHAQLIKEYEDIIKEKINIFTQMIKNLKTISEGNETYVKSEERIADQKLAIEVWDRDIYQKKRVNMDVQAEIQNALNQIEAIEKIIAERCWQIE